MPIEYQISISHAGDAVCRELNDQGHSLAVFAMVFTGAGRWLTNEEKTNIAKAALTEMERLLNKPIDDLPGWVNDPVITD